MASVGTLILFSLVASSVSLYRITEVNRILEAINHISVPLGRLFTQMQSDAEVFHRELERSLGASQWKDPYWRARPAPKWIEDILQSEMDRVRELTHLDKQWATAEARLHGQEWAKELSQDLEELIGTASKLYSALEQKNEPLASEIYTRLSASIDEWKRKLNWGSSEYERALRQNFSVAENRVVELRTGCELILIIVVLMSLLLLWLGERALRPLSELTRLARAITRRGLRKEDKSLFPEIPISRSDEVSQLAREFHHMATALLEREKTVETQKNRLQEQNRLLRDMGELNKNIMNSIESVLIVTDLSSKVTQCNPEAVRWLGGGQVVGSDLQSWLELQPFLEDGEKWLERLKQTAQAWKLGPFSKGSRVYGGYVMPLKQEQGLPNGAIIVLDDLTDEVDLQERLRQAENLAAVGRMSAQVAHEVRNPLQSIGLEAEMAAEMAAHWKDVSLSQSLNSILGSVDRLQKITENYLKLSRLSDGQKVFVDLGELLASVAATYLPVCEAQRVEVSIHWEPSVLLKVWVDRDLMEQVLGNLFRNSLQALEGRGADDPGRISWLLGNTETGKVWMRIEDNGPGIAPEVQGRLFTPFVTTRAQGTGLGLSFIKKVLEDHGGSIQILAQEKGSGACFEMILPFLPQRLEPGLESAHYFSSVVDEGIYPQEGSNDGKNFTCG